MPAYPLFRCGLLLALFLMAASASFGQAVQALRNKLSAGDLLSAESILEVHRVDKGEDGQYLQGLGWLARGAAMLGDWAAAETYSTKAMTLAEARLQVVGPTDTQSALQALGAAIEVKAAVIEHRDGRKAAAGYLTGQLNSFSSFDPAFRSRLYKRRNQLELVGSKAPAIRLEDYTGATAPSLPDKSQSPSVVFLWAEWCGDCRAQAAALRAAHDRFAAKGVRFVGLTRYYKEANAAEKQRVEQAWAQHYPGLASVPTVISTESMVRYGGSSTPTFVFLRADGTVTAYLPSRLTEQRLAAEIEKILP